MKHKSIFSTLIIIFFLIGLVLVPSTSTAEEGNQETTPPIITAPLQPDTGQQVEIGTDIPIQEQKLQLTKKHKQKTPSPQKPTEKSDQKTPSSRREDPFEVKESGGTLKVPQIPQPSK